MIIGIMTFWWSEDNYGQILQCYALQKYLRDLGHDAYLIRYDPRSDYGKNTILRNVINVFNPKKLKKYMSFKVRKCFTSIEKIAHNREFESFRKKNITVSDIVYFSYEELKNNPPAADLYIAGSDQIWNFRNNKLNKCRNLVNSYFLNFGQNYIKKASYAASWGTDSIEAEYINEIKKLIAKLNSVSVREKKGIELCLKCGYNNAKWVCDPTLLLKGSEYRKLYDREKLRTNSVPYILFYYVENSGKFKKHSVYEFAKKMGLKVIYVSGNMSHDKYKKKYATITEWLYLIDKAEYVITNSFHCCVFSYLFHKQFGAIKITGELEGMNTRFESLFEMLEIDDRYISEINFSVLQKKYIIKDSLKILELSKFYLNSILN